MSPTSNNNNQNSQEDSDFKETLATVKAIIPIVTELKNRYEKVWLLLEGSRFDGKESLIDTVSILKEEISHKVDKDKMDSVFGVQDKEIKRLNEIVEDIPTITKKLAKVEDFINGLKSVPKWFAWLPGILTNAVLMFVMYLVLSYYGIKK